jgi:hypothetical protein
MVQRWLDIQGLWGIHINRDRSGIEQREVRKQIDVPLHLPCLGIARTKQLKDCKTQAVIPCMQSDHIIHSFWIASIKFIKRV